MQGRGSAVIRRRLVCRGVVQGVGFRPAVYRLGRALGLVGHVRNDAEGATIEVQGAVADVAAFEAQLPQGLPPLATLFGVEATTLPLHPDAVVFEVAATVAGHRGHSLVPADAALCGRCRAEVEDPRDRRYRYPFITCTDCGPRFSLVRTLPYDRERTAMACFPLCSACAAEYADPGSRRFHAEPICCPACGPRLWLADADGLERAASSEALAQVRTRLAAGAIVAIKGLGGFQLACRADHDDVVARLRQRKQRPRKPFAVMLRDLAAAEGVVQLDANARALLGSAVGPIVLAPRREPCLLAAAIAPGIVDLGVMLPTTALHGELFRDAPYQALVMTSGNRRLEPICLGNREALLRLAGLADAFLLHDRDIVRRVDDSVVRTAPGGVVQVRRSRGLAPAPLPLPDCVPGPVLALGGHLQTTACVAVEQQAFLSQHVGDLDSEATRAYLREVATGLEQFLEVSATTIACDTHPDYPSRWLAKDLARQRGATLVPVPHHLAHAAAVLGEHGRFPGPGEQAAALVLDGTGHGPDGRAWGSELLLVDGQLRWSRAAHGEALPLVGGEAAVHEPWRIAVAVLAAAAPLQRWLALPFAALVERRRFEVVASLALREGWPVAHGAGRLFEAAGALLGLVMRNDYEGEAAARCEALAAACGDPTAAPWPEVNLPHGRSLVPQRALLVAAAERLLAGEAAPQVAFGLHRTFAALWVQLTQRELPTLRRVALGGGCLVNRILLQELSRGFAAAGIEVLSAQQLPPGDGGLAYGQCVIAAVARSRACSPTFSAVSSEV